MEKVQRINDMIEESDITTVIEATHFDHAEANRRYGETNRRYLPMGVWKRKGFDEERIEKEGDRKWDVELDWLYGFTVKKLVSGSWDG